MNNDNKSSNCDTSTVKESVTGLKNAFTIKQGPYQPRCPNCGYCPHCGQSNDYTPYHIPPWRPYWYATPPASATVAPLTTNGTVAPGPVRQSFDGTWSANKNGTAGVLGQSPISFIVLGVKAH